MIYLQPMLIVTKGYLKIAGRFLKLYRLNFIASATTWLLKIHLPTALDYIIQNTSYAIVLLLLTYIHILLQIIRSIMIYGALPWYSILLLPKAMFSWFSAIVFFYTIHYKY